MRAPKRANPAPKIARATIPVSTTSLSLNAQASIRLFALAAVEACINLQANSLRGLIEFATDPSCGLTEACMREKYSYNKQGFSNFLRNTLEGTFFDQKEEIHSGQKREKSAFEPIGIRIFVATMLAARSQVPDQQVRAVVTGGAVELAKIIADYLKLNSIVKPQLIHSVKQAVEGALYFPNSEQRLEELRESFFLNYRTSRSNDNPVVFLAHVLVLAATEIAVKEIKGQGIPLRTAVNFMSCLQPVSTYCPNN